MSITKRIPASLTFLFFMTLLVGVAYPALVTAIAQLAFSERARGSIVRIDGKARGSFLLAQKFESPRYFRARPSASDYAYIGASATNLGPVSGDLGKAVTERRAAWSGNFGTAIPEDMLYSSASGLDPDISLEAVLAQAPKVAAARTAGSGGKSAEAEASIASEARKRAAQSTGPIGPPRINVVSLNVWLDATFPMAKEGDK